MKNTNKDKRPRNKGVLLIPKVRSKGKKTFFSLFLCIGTWACVNKAWDTRTQNHHLSTHLH